MLGSYKHVGSIILKIMCACKVRIEAVTACLSGDDRNVRFPDEKELAKKNKKNKKKKKKNISRILTQFPN